MLLPTIIVRRGAGVFTGALLLIAAQSAAAAPDAFGAEPETIVVTGERVKRSLKQTSSSVAVATQREIEAASADRLDEVLTLVPNVQLGSGSQGPAIRGQDTTGALNALPAFLGGNRPRTTIVVDGRAVTYNEFVFGTFPVWDVNRIEVFRSPQTTTQGQNSIAGAIFVHTNDPSFSPEYAARGIAGDFKMREVSALASGPLAGDSVAFRLAGDFRYRRTTSRIDDVQAGANPNHDVFGLLRAKLLARPAPNTEIVTTYVHSQSQSPQVVGISKPFRDRRDTSPGYGIFRVKVDSLTTAVRQQASGDLTANLLFTAGESSARRFAIPHFGETTNRSRDWSAEAIVNWTPAGAFRATAGVSQTHVGLKQYIDLALLSGSIGRFRDWQDGTGLFGEAQLALSSRTTLTAGLRYQRDRQKRVGSLAATNFTVPVDFVGTFDSWLPKVSLAYDLTPAVRVGAMVEKAYNPGGTTIRVDTSRPNNFAAEKLWDYELFTRADLAGGRGKLDANLFYYDMRDAQRSEDILVFTPSGRPVGFANLCNVPKARSYGAEGQLSWRFGDNLSGSLAVGLLGTRVLRSSAAAPEILGKQFDRSPHFTASAAADWAISRRLRVSGQIRHHSTYFTDPENSAALRVGSATFVNARAEYRLDRVTLFGQVKNLFNTFRLVDRLGPGSAEAEDPRMFGLGVEARL